MDHDTIVRIIDEAIAAKGISASKASRLIGDNPSIIKNIKSGRVPSVITMDKICKALGINFHIALPSQIEEPKAEVRYLGTIAAGGGDHPAGMLVVGFEDIGYETTAAPAGLKPEQLTCWGGLCALEVKGNSMSPKYNDGDMIYIYGDDPLKYSPERLVGKECAVYLGGDREGESYLKRLRWGDKRNQNLWNLESINQEWKTIEDVEIIDIRPVRYQKVGGL